MIREKATADAGFSMLELLVVLAVLATVFTFALPLYTAPGPSTDINIIALELASQLKALRARAIAANCEQTFILDTPAHSYIAGLNTPPTILPKTVALTMETAREVSREPGAAGLIFYPTGGTSGGLISLTQGGNRRIVTVDWLTGTVAIGRDFR